MAAYHGETVTYTAIPVEPGGMPTVTTGVLVRVSHLADLSPATQQPYQQRTYMVPTATIAKPRRGDYITDSDGEVWTVKDVRRPVGGETYCQTLQGQVRA